MSADTDRKSTRASHPPHQPHWLRDRLGWKRLVAQLHEWRVESTPIAFGRLVLLLFLVQAASGLLLLLYYRPDVEHAHESVERIVGEIPYGALVRGVHAWSADLFTAVLLAHFFVVIVRRTFRAPRELGWFSGHATLILGIGLAFTGMMLPWSQKAYSQARVGSEIAHYTPLVGDWLRRFLRGGDEVGTSTLSHAFGFHVAVLPALMTLGIAAHIFFLVRAPSGERHGKREQEERLAKTIPFYPDWVVREAATMMGVLVVLGTLAIFFPQPLGKPADLTAASAGDALPPWYFLAVHQIIRVSPAKLLGMDSARFLVGSACVFGLLVVALPFIDRRGSKITPWIAWLMLGAFILLGTSALR